MSAKKILYICQEIVPYLPDSEIATTCRYLPQAAMDGGYEIRTFMPKFGNVNERRNQLHEVIRLSGMNLIISDNDHPLIIKVASIQSARMQVYFIDNEDFFRRRSTVADASGKEYSDNEDRMIFYIRGVIETVRKLRWVPDIIHCHGWFSALAPVYIKKAFADDPFFKNAKLVYSIYDDAFQQVMSKDFGKKIIIEGIQPDDLTDLQPKADYEAVTKLAVRYSDAVVLAQPNVDAKVAEIAKASGKPLLEGNTDNNYASYVNFYNTLTGQNQ